MGSIFVVLVAGYVWMYFFARKRQRKFDDQYNSAKVRYEVFVLNKKIAKERGQTRITKYTKFKTYQVIGRINVSQAVKGMQMNRMQTLTFQTNKGEFEKIQVNRKYKMDVAGNYIGFVQVPLPSKSSVKTSTAKDKNNRKSVRRFIPFLKSRDENKTSKAKS